MADFTIRTPSQLSAVLRGFRRAEQLTQTQLAARLGITQQSLSSLERNAESIGFDRLARVLAVLGVELVLRKADPDYDVSASPSSSSTCRLVHPPEW